MYPNNVPTRRSARTAFSLIEIVLAVAIISFALVAILGLFPVALQNATDSQRTTQAALIARTIFSDLDLESGQNRFVFLGKADPGNSDTGSGKESDRAKASVDLLTGTSVYLGYDADGLPISQSDSKISAADYNSGTSKAAYVVEIRPVIEPPAPTPPPGVTQVEITIGAPGRAPKDKRTSYPFVTLLDNGRAPTTTP
jgi:type II secretory pathway pseudopilin PulG